jgi:methyltransferase family protein
MKIPPEIEDYCTEIAKKAQVTPLIHPNDFIFRFLIDNPSFPSKKDAVNYYFTDGENSAKVLQELIHNALALPKHASFKLLEFASGYGCVTRHFTHYLPNARITCCDIHQEAINFIKSQLSTDAVLSRSIPEKLQFSETYDVIFALSFFSHMPESTWGRWIRKLYSALNDHGYLIFTTHGKVSNSKYLGNVSIPANGFYFKPDSEQQDLEKSEYGTTVTTPEFVIGEMYKQIMAPLVLYKEGFWWQHQDLYIVAGRWENFGLLRRLFYRLTRSWNRKRA